MGGEGYWGEADNVTDEKNFKPRASDICSALRLRFPRESHALLFEVADTTGGTRRYADAVAIGLWSSHGHAIEGVEVKISRSDFLNEMKQPQKSEAVFKFCNRWWLACPKDMVKPAEIPHTWGLLELHSDGVLRQKVKAPKLTPIGCTMGFLAALLRRHAGVDEEMAKNEIDREVQMATERIRVRLEEKAKNDYSSRVRLAEESLKTVERIKEETGLDLTSHRHRDDELIAAIQLAMKLRGRWNSPLKNLRASSELLIAAIDESGLAEARNEV